MATYSQLREYILDSLWSQWHELGVAATVPRRHSVDFIDPEPLIAFTATHSDLDPRLRDESIDWILRYGTYVSKARLKNVLTEWGLLGNPLFREYAATVNANGRAGWPAAGAKPLAFRSRARTRLEDLTRPALVSLRIRGHSRRIFANGNGAGNAQRQQVHYRNAVAAAVGDIGVLAVGGRVGRKALLAAAGERQQNAGERGESGANHLASGSGDALTGVSTSSVTAGTLR